MLRSGHGKIAAKTDRAHRHRGGDRRHLRGDAARPVHGTERGLCQPGLQHGRPGATRAIAPKEPPGAFDAITIRRGLAPRYREGKMADNDVPRRSFLKTAGAAGTLAATALAGALPRAAEAQTSPAQPAAAVPPTPEPLLTLNADEAAFFSAAYDTIIPADRLSPSGTDCGLVAYIDRQLAGAWGNGARLYRNGPFLPARPEHGYQLPLTPREYFAAGIRSANSWSRKTYGKHFSRR